MCIGIKVGSSLLTKKSKWGERINKRFIESLMLQLSQLVYHGHKVFLVSSGAVASDHNLRRSKELRASVGQHKLMAMYQNILSNRCHPARDAAQILLVADDLKYNRRHIKKLIEEAFVAGVLPIINANDPVNSDELDRLKQLEDNDKLFGAVSRILKPDWAIIVTDVDGVLDENHKVINIFSRTDRIAIARNIKGNSSGKGGIISKINVAKKLAEHDTKAIIVNGHKEDFIMRAIERLANDPYSSHTAFGTVFIK